MIALFLTACSPSRRQTVNRLNDIAYAFHYQDLDSTYHYAKKADSLAQDYDEGKAAALNNLAFYHIAKMEYDTAYVLLHRVGQETDNQVELLIADVQLMRLCQRESRNKDFYDYREQAELRLRRIAEEEDRLSDRQLRRMVYARSEYRIVEATYFYYVGLNQPFRQSLEKIDPEEVEQDTAQYLGYLYNMGAGGAIAQGTRQEIAQQEFDYLLRCYTLSHDKYPYWHANSMQAISEHLQDEDARRELMDNNPLAFDNLNVDQMPDSLLAGNLAQRALQVFTEYGDVYQIAGANRTLGQCFWEIGDYESALICLNNALTHNPAIQKAPDLVASIREELSLAYSAINDKAQSDYNRNIYLDLQEQTRQDRLLEARVAQLDRSAMVLNAMIIAVVAMIAIVVVLLVAFSRMRKRSERRHPLSKLLDPLKEWKDRHQAHVAHLEERHEELQEEYQMSKLLIEKQLKRNIEQRAKVQLVTSITPFIDRMMHEVDALYTKQETPQQQAERHQYITELTDKINEYNDVLTRWIEMRQGELTLKIESFPLQALLDIVQKGKMAYQMKGITLHVNPTEAVVKADRTLTLFMVNTIADNARKFTEPGGRVTIEAHERDDAVEISVADTGKGMTEEQMGHLFDRAYTGGHGFGLLNCKGIIEKYKKISSIFHVCDIHAESQVGQGTKVTFRLPRGVARLLVALCSLLSMGAQPLSAQAQDTNMRRARQYADSTYACNVAGRYRQALQYADSARMYLNRYYQAQAPHEPHRPLMTPLGTESTPAEIQWHRDGEDMPYDIILSVRNESAVAALALHEWDVYRANNKIYTQLFRVCSADSSLPSYVTSLQESESNKNVAVALLICLLLSIFPASYVLYYRHVLYRRFAVDRLHAINETLLSTDSNEDKLRRIEALWKDHQRMSTHTQELDDIVQEICEALRQGIAADKDRSVSIEMAADELRRAAYENERLHVSNSVLDNCLSTLKHETMYYPSRIKQLVADHPNDIQALRELVDYYKSLYDMLSEQALQQVEGNLRFDESLRDYLVDTLRHIAGRITCTQEDDPQQAAYTICRVTMPDMAYTDLQRQQLFTPLTQDLRYLVCKQIVREIGEATNLRRCGIQAVAAQQGTEIAIILPKKLRHKT